MIFRNSFRFTSPWYLFFFPHCVWLYISCIHISNGNEYIPLYVYFYSVFYHRRDFFLPYLLMSNTSGVFKETGSDYIRGHLVSLPVFVRSVMIIFQVLCIVIGCFIYLRSVSYARCCLFLWGVHCRLSLLFSPTFINSVCLYWSVCPLMITLINATPIIVI